MKMKVMQNVKDVGKKALMSFGTMVFFVLFSVKKALCSGISDSSIMSAASESTDTLFTILGGAFVVLGVGSCIFAGYNLYQTMTEGGSGQASQKATGFFAAGIVAFIVGILCLTVFKNIIKKGLGLS